MPWWMYIYLAAMFGFSCYCYREDITKKRHRAMIAADIASDLFLVLVALANWYEFARLAVSPSPVAFFVAGICLTGFSIVDELKDEIPDPEYSFAGNCVFAVLGFVAACVLLSPLLYYGGVYVLGTR